MSKDNNKTEIALKQAKLKSLNDTKQRIKTDLNETNNEIKKVESQIKLLEQQYTCFVSSATVGSLMDSLAKYPSDMKIAVDYEDGYSTIDIRTLSVHNKNYDENETEKRLVIK